MYKCPIIRFIYIFLGKDEIYLEYFPGNSVFFDRIRGCMIKCALLGNTKNDITARRSYKKDIFQFYERER